MTGNMLLYFDEDVDVLLTRLLTPRGFDCLSALDANNLAKTDSEHLEFAARQGRVLVTHNRVDFEKLAKEWWQQRRDHAGIILAVRRADTYDLARRLLPVLNRYDQMAWKNLVMYA